MTPDALVEELKKRRVSLTAHGDEIKFSAPKGAVDAVLRRAMQANKQALFAYARATDAPHVAARPSKKFSLSVPRPALAPLIDPDWRPNHPFLQWVERDKGYLLDQLQIAKVFERAEGAHMWTSEGAQILDCLSQYGSLPFGHNPPEIWDALEECRASGRPAFSANGLSDAAGALAARLIGLWPEAGFDGVVFTNSGAESLEAAIKLARAATGRAALLSAKGGFHGLTIGALGVAGSDSYREGFAVPVDPRDRVPYGDVEALEAAFEAEPRRFAALMLEPLQGEAGIIDPPAGYLARARELCDAHGTLLVLDEVQSGLGRTGEMFASQYHGVIPDIMTLAKALGGGVMPVGATLYNARARSEAFGLRHSSTFAGGALAASAGLAALDYLTEDNCALLAHVRKTGAFLRARLEALQSRFPEFITGLSGRGMMQGIRLDFASLHEKPGLLGLVTQQNLTIHLVVSHLLNKGGVRLAPSFSAGDVLRIQPPLTVREDELEPLFAALEATLGALRAGDTGEVLAHLIGVEDRAPSEAKPPVTGPRPTIEARPAQAGEGRFAFVVHPLDIADFARLDPGLGGVEHGKLAGLVDRLSHFIDPFPIERLEIAGSGGARAYGELILVPHTPDVLMRMPAAKAEEEFGLAVDVAHERG
ncbi:MAG: aminotransferase class III-fold pyridoxal phosphate-dependent enzyme, partial [Pseudomonadota bacterium]